jgi:hypothetical protein
MTTRIRNLTTPVITPTGSVERHLIYKGDRAAYSRRGVIQMFTVPFIVNDRTGRQLGAIAKMGAWHYGITGTPGPYTVLGKARRNAADAARDLALGQARAMF